MSEWLDLKDKVYVVTGGSSGIGYSIIEGLLEVGTKVANFDIAPSDIDNDNYLFVEVDVTSREAVETGVDKVVEKFGTIDGLVNNAGIMDGFEPVAIRIYLQDLTGLVVFCSRRHLDIDDLLVHGELSIHQGGADKPGGIAEE